jgi:hypothetical protein
MVDAVTEISPFTDAVVDLTVVDQRHERFAATSQLRNGADR